MTDGFLSARTAAVPRSGAEAARGDHALGETHSSGFRAYGSGRTVGSKPGAIERVRAAVGAVGSRTRLPVAAAKPQRDAPGAERGVWALIAALLVAASSVLALNAARIDDAVRSHAVGISGFLLVTLALQLLSVDLYGSGAESASAIGILAADFVFGPPAAIAVAVLAALAQWARRQAVPHRGLFDVANFALSAASAAYVYQTVADASSADGARVAGAIGAAVVYRAVNSGLLCLAMSRAEAARFWAVWRERFRWASLHYFAYGPLAFACALAYAKMGLVGLIAFAVPPALLTVSLRQYLSHTRASVEEVRRANEALRRSNIELEASNQRVRKTHLATIAALSRSMEAKDHYTGGHIERVAAIAVALAHKLGYRGDELDAIEIGALLHDIGKIGIPEPVLHKRGPLSDEEWETMREHPVISDHILSEVDMHPFVRQIARWSHERIDGRGYPDGLAGNEIPLPARITLVADAFDALTSDRPYRAGRSAAAAMKELREHAGTQFCPLAVEALEHLWRERAEILDEGGESRTEAA